MDALENWAERMGERLEKMRLVDQYGWKPRLSAAVFLMAIMFGGLGVGLIKSGQVALIGLGVVALLIAGIGFLATLIAVPGRGP